MEDITKCVQERQNPQIRGCYRVSKRDCNTPTRLTTWDDPSGTSNATQMKTRIFRRGIHCSSVSDRAETSDTTARGKLPGERSENTSTRRAMDRQSGGRLTRISGFSLTLFLIFSYLQDLSLLPSLSLFPLWTVPLPLFSLLPASYDQSLSHSLFPIHRVSLTLPVSLPPIHRTSSFSLPPHHILVNKTSDGRCDLPTIIQNELSCDTSISLTTKLAPCFLRIDKCNGET